MRYIVPNDDKVRTIPLGRMGENLYTEIAFDISAWQREYTIDSIVLFMLRAQDAPDSAYPAALTIEGNYAVHVLTSTDLEYIGTGKCQLQMTSGAVIAKSKVYSTICLQSIASNGEAPAPWQEWWASVGATATTLPAGETATASYDPVTNQFSFAIPKGDPGTLAPLDRTLTLEDYAADAKATGDALDTKANVDGYYESLTAGNAEQLVGTVAVDDKYPYLFRTTGGSLDVGDRKNVKQITGGTIVWNQLIANGNFADGTTGWQVVNGTISAADGVLTFKATASGGWVEGQMSRVEGHKYLTCASIQKTNATEDIMMFPTMASSPYRVIDNTEWQRVGAVWVASASGLHYFPRVYSASPSGWANVYVKDVMCIDLTLAFGSTIADYLYSLEQAEQGSGYATLKAWGFAKKDYYSYTAGTLESVCTSAQKTVGFNAYNHTTGKAKVVGGVGYQVTGDYTSLTLDGSAITPDEDGYFTPSADGEITVVGGDADTTCIHIVWDGSRDDEFEEYAEHTYALDESLTLRGIPMLDANNRLYYDGDKYAPDGTVTRRYGTRAYQAGDVTDGATMITDGVNTVYKLTTPTTESADAFTNPQVIDDFGTEEYIDYPVSQGTRDVAIPVGHISAYQSNLVAKLEMSPDSPSGGDGDYIVRQTGGMNEYVPLASNPTISALLGRIPEAPANDGTYTLKCVVSGGVKTYSWVAG